MANPFLGEIRIMPYNFAPQGWAFCDGQVLAISQFTALFSLLGTTYGGNGTSNFALPDLRGRVAISSGQGPGLSPYNIGQVGGVENVTLTSNTMPQHSHQVVANNGPGDATRPAGAVPARTGTSNYASAPDGTAMNAGMLSAAGGGQPHSNLQPYLVLNFCIAMQGIFPSRN
jgi:microcystin-dependent protein